MATPEQNTLLALQLFGAPAQQFAQQNDTRTNLMLRIAQMDREERLKRELTDREATSRRELAGMQADREDTRQLGAERRQINQLNALQTRDDTRVAESERRQNVAIEAAEKKQILAEMNRLYPQYAAAAAQAGVEIKPRSEFPETNEGLGQLAAELNTAKIGFDNKRFEAAADAAVAELEDAKTALTQTRNRLLELSKPSKDDEKFARTRAVAALKKSIESGEIESLTKLKPKAINDGLAALTRGEETIAETLLGEEAMMVFAGALEQTLMALPNTKARLQDRAQVQQQLLQLQTQTARVESDLRKGAAANPFLGEKLKSSRSSLQQLMTPVEAPKRQRSFEELTPAAGAAPSETPTSTSTSAPAYKYPALSVLGASERINGIDGSQLAGGTANILASPGRVIDAAGRVGSAGLQGLMTGNYSVPERGVIQMVGERFGHEMAKDFPAGNEPRRDVEVPFPWSLWRSQPKRLPSVEEILSQRSGGDWGKDQ